MLFRSEEDKNSDIRLKKFVIDELGISSFRNNGFDPKYDYYITEDNYLIVNIECPGDTSIETELVNDYHWIQINGIRMKYEPKDCKSIGIEREYGNFTITIPTEYILEEVDDREIKKEDGIQTLFFHIYEGRKKKKNI